MEGRKKLLQMWRNPWFFGVFFSNSVCQKRIKTKPVRGSVQNMTGSTHWLTLEAFHVDFLHLPKNYGCFSCITFSPHKKGQIQLGCFHCTHRVGPDSESSFHASIFVSTSALFTLIQAPLSNCRKRGQVFRKTLPAAGRAEEQFLFFTWAPLLSPPPLPSCWPDKGRSLHHRPPQISHLLCSKGQAKAQLQLGWL